MAKKIISSVNRPNDVAAISFSMFIIAKNTDDGNYELKMIGIDEINDQVSVDPIFSYSYSTCHRQLTGVTLSNSI